MKLFFVLLSMVICFPLTSMVRAQELDGSDLNNEIRDRNGRINQLTLDEQLKLRAAQTKAAEDPAVQEALRKRNEAIKEFRTAIRAAMIKADPTVEPIIAKVAVPPTQTP